MPKRVVSQQARDLVAIEIAAQGPLYLNIANMVRCGFMNIWLEPSLQAVQAALDMIPDDPEEAD